MSDPVLFMIEEHPSKDLVRIQIDSNAILLNSENQEKVYNYLKKRLGK